MTGRHERGFSLVELMVAITVTLIVSGAIYGLLTSGSNAFRREPELADRQQNIRAAMDLVARDVFNAGAGVPRTGQVFTTTEAGGGCGGSLNGCGPQGTLGADAAAARGGDLENTDVVEMVAVDEQCPLTWVCSTNPVAGNPGLYVTRESIPRCMRLPGFALLTDNTNFLIQPANRVATAPQPCPGGVAAPPILNGNIALGPATGLPSSAASLEAGAQVFLYPGRVVRYRIAPGLDPADTGLPSLWRSETGRFTVDGAEAPEPGEAGFPGTGSPWELVARGIEDLQVEYLDGDGAAVDPDQWRNQPQVVTATGWRAGLLVRQVRITLSARTSAGNLQGQTRAAGAPDAVRGQLSTTVSPRAALNELQMANEFR